MSTCGAGGGLPWRWTEPGPLPGQTLFRLCVPEHVTWSWLPLCKIQRTPISVQADCGMGAAAKACTDWSHSVPRLRLNTLPSAHSGLNVLTGFLSYSGFFPFWGWFSPAEALYSAPISSLFPIIIAGLGSSLR